jgi:hypothetical protein
MPGRRDWDTRERPEFVEYRVAQLGFRLGESAPRLSDRRCHVHPLREITQDTGTRRSSFPAASGNSLESPGAVSRVLMVQHAGSTTSLHQATDYEWGALWGSSTWVHRMACQL